MSTRLDALCTQLADTGALTDDGARLLRAALGSRTALTIQVEAAEVKLLADWHGADCGCQRWPTDCFTFPFTHDDPAGWRAHVPASFSDEAVLAAVAPTP